MKKLLLMLLALVATSAWAQTDVTSTYLTNADFSEGPVITADIRGYGKDMVSGDVYGFQDVTGWTKVVTAGDNANASYPNSAMGGGVLAYGSTNQLKGNNVTAPAAGPTEGAANGLGFFGVWGCGGYYYQDVTLAAGKYKLTFPIYCISGTQANTTYTGFFPTSGTNRTVAINTTVGSWVNQTVEFTLAAETAGQIRLGYQSTGSGSGANPHLVFDGVKIEFTAVVVRDVLETAITAATNANATLNNSDLAAAISTAQAVYDNENATQDEVNAAAATLNVATELAMSDAGDVTNIFLTNADFASLDGWTLSASTQYHDQGNYQIGGSTNVRFAAPTADDTHLTSEYALGFECRWSTNYTSYYQTTSALPAGVYKFTFDVENVNGSTTSATYNNLFYVQVGDTKYTDTATEWMRGKSSWTTHTITVTLTEASPVTLSLGYGTGSNNLGADNTPALYVSHLSMSYSSFLAGAKDAWDEAKAAAEAAVANEEYENVTGEELTALNAEIAKTEPTTIEGYNEATEALTTATNTFTAAKASYDAFYAIANSDYVTTLDYGTEEKRQALNDVCTEVPTSAADAVEKTAAVYTALRAYYESHAMAENVEEAVDMTDHIANATEPTNNDGWTWTGNKNNPASNEPWTDADGTNEHSYFDGGNWGANSWTTTMEQTITIPSGRYLLTAKGRAAVNTTLTMSVGEESVELPHVGSTGNVFDRGWGDASLEFETTDGSATIKVTATSSTLHEWFSISNFRLVQLEEIVVPMADADDYAALASAIETAENNSLGFDAGEYAPYNNVEALQALAAAKAIDPEAADGNTKEVVNNATTALTSASWTANTSEVDAIFDGQFATTESLSESGKVVLPGWTKVEGIRLLVKDEATDPGLAYTDGKAAVFAWGGTTLTYGEQEGYTLPMNKHELYELTLKVSGWRDGDMPNVMTIALDGASQTVNAQELGAKAINVSEGNPFATLKFYVTPTADNSKLTIYANHHFTIADLSLKLAVAEEITLDETVAFEQAEETYANVTMNRKVVAGINAVAVPFDLTTEQVKAVFGENAQVYTFEDVPDGENSQINFNTKEENTIEANVPVLVGEATASNSQTINGVILKTGEARVKGTNFDFVGNYAGTVKVAANDYFVSGGKLYKSAGETNLKGFRAFIQNMTNTAGEVKLYIDGVATSIEAIENGQLTIDNEAIYNLAGQRVSKATKGIFIKNGKKVVVK